MDECFKKSAIYFGRKDSLFEDKTFIANFFYSCGRSSSPFYSLVISAQSEIQIEWCAKEIACKLEFEYILLNIRRTIQEAIINASLEGRRMPDGLSILLEIIANKISASKTQEIFLHLENVDFFEQIPDVDIVSVILAFLTKQSCCSTVKRIFFLLSVRPGKELPRGIRDNIYFTSLRCMFLEELGRFPEDKEWLQAAFQDGMSIDQVIYRAKLFRKQNGRLPNNAILHSHDDWRNLPGVFSVGITCQKGIVQKCHANCLHAEKDGNVEILGRGALPEVLSMARFAMDFLEKKACNGIKIWIDFQPDNYLLEGRSSNMAVFLAVYMALSNKIPSTRLGATGVIASDGSVLQVGALVDKLITFYNWGINLCVVPILTKQQHQTLPSVIKHNMTLIELKNIEEILPQIENL